MVKGVIFDMDGLMFDTERVWSECWEPVCAAYGITVPEGMLEGVRGRAGSTMLEALRHFLGEEAPVEVLWEDEKRMALARICEGVAKKPGLDDLLEYLHDCGTPMAVASSSPKALIEANLARAGIAGHFDVLVSGEDLGRGKPNPQIFLETVSLLGTDPSSTLVLEDSPAGVEAAHRGGFLTVMVPDMDEPTKAVREMADAVVAELGEVIDLIEDGTLGRRGRRG